MSKSALLFVVAAAASVATLLWLGRGDAAGAPQQPDIAPAAQLPKSETLELADDAGRRVKLPARPKRVACAVSFASEMLCALGRPPILRNKIPEAEVFPPEAKDIPVFDVDHGTGPNLEQLTAAQPDLVICSPVFARFVPTIEERLKVPVLVLKIDHFDQIAEKLRLLGQLTDSAARADELAAKLAADVKGLAAGLPPKGPRVAAVFGTTQGTLGFYPDSYFGSLIRQLNGEVLVAGAEPNAQFRSMYNVSLEKLAAADPDLILMTYHGPATDAAKVLRNEAAWNGLRAVKAGRVHAVSQRLFVTNPGLRAVEALTQLRAMLYPEK